MIAITHNLISKRACIATGVVLILQLLVAGCTTMSANKDEAHASNTGKRVVKLEFDADGRLLHVRNEKGEEEAKCHHEEACDRDPNAFPTVIMADEPKEAQGLITCSTTGPRLCHIIVNTVHYCVTC